MNHDIPTDVPNSTILFCIDEYVRLERDREILKDHWFRGVSFMDLCKQYDLSLTTIKNIIWKGDDILIRAEKMTLKNDL